MNTHAGITYKIATTNPNAAVRKRIKIIYEEIGERELIQKLGNLIQTALDFLYLLGYDPHS